MIDAASLFHEYLCLPDQDPSDLAVGIISRIVPPSRNVVCFVNWEVPRLGIVSYDLVNVIYELIKRHRFFDPVL